MKKYSILVLENLPDFLLGVKNILGKSQATMLVRSPLKKNKVGAEILRHRKRDTRFCSFNVDFLNF